MSLNRTILADALHNASQEVVLIPRDKKGRITKADLSEVVKRQQHGRGVIVGVVAGLMARGIPFDDAWQTCLQIKPDIDWRRSGATHCCVPPEWPSLADYQEVDVNAKKSDAAGGIDTLMGD